MRHQRCSVLGGHFRHRDQLVGVGESSREIDEAEREHARTRFQRKTHLVPHLLQTRRNPFGTRDEIADSAMTD